MSSGNIATEWGMYVDAGIGDVDLPINTGDGNDYARYAPTTATRFTDAPEEGVALPSDANCAVIVVEDNPIRIRVGTGDATADEGVLWFADSTHTFENQRTFLQNVSFIDTAAGAASVTVLWGRA